MTLGFYTKLPNGEPTHFVEKIQKCRRQHCGDNAVLEFSAQYMPQDFNSDVYRDCAPKLHTIRTDEKRLWRRGQLIHPVIHNRTPRRFQFAPTFACVSVQRVFMTYDYGEYLEISIDGRQLLTHEELEQFAKNDGFDTWSDFFNWFHPIIEKSEDKEYSGKIIHFTNLEY